MIYVSTEGVSNILREVPMIVGNLKGKSESTCTPLYRKVSANALLRALQFAVIGKVPMGGVGCTFDLRGKH